MNFRQSAITLTVAVMISLFTLAAIVHAGDLTNKDKSEIQQAMKDYVKAQSAGDGQLPVVHDGKVFLLELRTSEKYPDGFHTGIVSEGGLHASCADFTDKKTGKKYDIDFLVNKVKDKYLVVQPIVHKIDGVKNPYDLAH